MRRTPKLRAHLKTLPPSPTPPPVKFLPMLGMSLLSTLVVGGSWVFFIVILYCLGRLVFGGWRAGKLKA